MLDLPYVRYYPARDYNLVHSVKVIVVSVEKAVCAFRLVFYPVAFSGDISALIMHGSDAGVNSQ